MMKRFSLSIVILTMLASVFMGCNSTSGDDTVSSLITAPDIGRASDLPSSGGISPGNESSAITLFSDACNALNTEIETYYASSQNPSARAAMTARTTVSMNETYELSYSPAGGGTIAYFGSQTGYLASPDNGWTPSPNTFYNDLASISIDVTVNGTLSGVVVSDASYSYTINGLAKNRMRVTGSIDLATGSDGKPVSASLDFSLGIGIGTAVSIRRNDGVGAKFLITYGANYGRNGIDVLTNIDTAFLDELATYLGSQPATLRVYDDGNNMIFEKTLTADQAYAASILSSMEQ